MTNSILPGEGAYARLVELLCTEQLVTQGVRKGFGRAGLFFNGNLFATLTKSGLLVKLPDERIASLVSDRIAIRFQTSGRRMRDWAILKPDADWTALARESLEFVRRIRK